MRIPREKIPIVSGNIGVLHLLLIPLLISPISTTTTTSSSSPEHVSPIILDSSPDPPPLDIACEAVNCIQGSCRETSSFPGFECDCYPGWIKVLGFCVIPNCSLNLQYTNETLPPPSPLPPLGLFTPCFLVWCGDGECVPEGTTNHTCECNNGADNLLGNNRLPCFRQCNLGADCRGVQIGPPIPPPPPPTSSAPSGLASPPNGSRSYKALSTILVAAIILIYIWI